jgi:hypothetical protein
MTHEFIPSTVDPAQCAFGIGPQRQWCCLPASADIHMPDTAKDAQGATEAQEQPTCLACSPELPDATGLCSVHASAPALKAENERLRARDRLWNEAFGTTQLTHAKARLENAESKVERLERENERLRTALMHMLYIFDRGLEKPTIGRKVCDEALEALEALKS